MKYLAYDIIAIFVFAVLARMAHGGLGVAEVLNTWWPFALGVLIGWMLIRGKDAATVKQGVTVWLSAAVAGLAIWGIRHQEFPHWSFILVASIMSALLLLGWRAVAAKFSKKPVAA